MPDILIIGGAGMLGAALAARLRAEGQGPLTLFDITQAAPAPGSTIQTGDLSEPGVAEALVASRPATIFHLAAIVSGEAERDFEKGYRINLDGTRLLFEAIRKAHLADGYRPRLVFTSSIAVFGSPLPDLIGDDHLHAPRTSYGTQKAICELLLADYSRRGFMEGVGIRLPTICIRPGKPNAAASGFFSNILREPLAGLPAVLPVPRSVRHWFASPRAAVGFMLHAARLPDEALAPRRNLTMPGVAATVADEIAALRAVAGDAAVALIRDEPDPAIAAIVSTWPEAFDPTAGLALGFRPDASFQALIRAYQEDYAPKAS